MASLHMLVWPWDSHECMWCVLYMFHPPVRAVYTHAAGSCVAPGDEASYIIIAIAINWPQPLGLGLGRPVRKLRARVASLRMYIHAYA